MYGAITHYGQTFQTVPLFTHQSAGPRSLVATEGVSIDFLSSGYLDISVPRVRLATLCIQVTIPLMRWVSPFGNPRLKAYLSAPRGLSQTYTSFIAFCRQGIHHVRLVTWSYNPKPSHCESTRFDGITLYKRGAKILMRVWSQTLGGSG